MTFIILIEPILYFFCICTILNNVYGCIPRNHKLIYSFPIIYFPFTIISIFASQDVSNFLFITVSLLAIFTLKYIFNASKFRSIISIYIFLYSIDTIITSIIVFTANTQYHYSIKYIISFVINIILTVSFILICKVRQARIKNTFALIPTNIKRITFVSLILSTDVINLISDFAVFKSIENWNLIIKISLLFLIVFIGAAFTILIANSIEKSFYLKQLDCLKQQIQAQAEHYEALSRYNYELRRFKHDYNNILIGVSKLIKDGNSKDALKMLNNYDNDLNTITNEIIKFDTGNGIVDAMLIEKHKKAITVNTVIAFEGTVPLNAIAATDLCIIFGNVLDNAIEACERITIEKKKAISIICKCNGGFMFLKITNPVAEDIQIHNNSISTTKSDKYAHSFGLYSLEKVIRKYDGDLKLKCENKLFVTNIELNLSM